MDPTIRSYDLCAEQYDKKNPDPDFWVKDLRSFAQNLKGRRVLDLGCGPGREGQFFRKRNLEHLGIDGSSAMARMARSRGVPVAMMDFLHLGIRPGTFNGVWAAASLLHVPKKSINEVLDSLHGILKSDGIGFFILKDGSYDGVIKRPHYDDMEFTVAKYRASEFARRLNESKFELREISYSRYDHGEWIGYLAAKA